MPLPRTMNIFFFSFVYLCVVIVYMAWLLGQSFWQSYFFFLHLFINFFFFFGWLHLHAFMCHCQSCLIFLACLCFDGWSTLASFRFQPDHMLFPHSQLISHLKASTLAFCKIASYAPRYFLFKNYSQSKRTLLLDLNSLEFHWSF